jgi:hypothetical protein
MSNDSMTEADRARFERVAARYGTPIFVWRNDDGHFLFDIQDPGMQRRCVRICPPPLTVEQQLRKDLDERARRIGMAKVHLADLVRHLESISPATSHCYWAINAAQRALRALNEGVDHQL